ncbi:hypothetical protein [Mariluticola halotolerans]|uniref:hypothetical protein n=1 Tax=Mariluticola halotolerans TaxID=2909283 RepID=UPI0026E43E94|nr:hypothetical protein [Mariluticola halotolerans]UJQ93231.1 hypothetical protein L1P08_09455 [Mariluticola halotolerans]
MDLDSAIRKLREDSERENATAAHAAPRAEAEDPSKLAIRSITEVAGQPASATKRPETQGHDELEHQMSRHRADIESIEAQLAKLDEAINVEQAKLRDTRLSLDQKYHARARLMHVREAMVQFVQVLEAQDAD